MSKFVYSYDLGSITTLWSDLEQRMSHHKPPRTKNLSAGITTSQKLIIPNRSSFRIYYVSKRYVPFLSSWNPFDKIERLFEKFFAFREGNGKEGGGEV